LSELAARFGICLVHTRSRSIALIFGLFVAVSAAGESEQRWAKELAAFAAADERQPPALGGALFVGSSSIRLWTTLTVDFPGLPVANRGFGGASLTECVANFELLVTRHAPEIVMLYAGTNDLAEGATPAEVADSFRKFCERLHAALPQSELWFLSIVAAPARWHLREKMEEANRLIAEYCGSDSRVRFVDATVGLLDEAGAPNAECFVDDRLHLSPAGYAAWRALLVDPLAAWRRREAESEREAVPAAP
jgi:lysophospholipase L1-like esterase